jgi:hypothetical protein
VLAFPVSNLAGHRLCNIEGGWGGGCRWSSLVVAGRHWSRLVAIGRHWSSLVVTGRHCHWSSLVVLVVAGRRWSSLVVAGRRWSSQVVAGRLISLQVDHRPQEAYWEESDDLLDISC